VGACRGGAAVQVGVWGGGVVEWGGGGAAMPAQTPASTTPQPMRNQQVKTSNRKGPSAVDVWDKQVTNGMEPERLQSSVTPKYNKRRATKTRTSQEQRRPPAALQRSSGRHSNKRKPNARQSVQIQINYNRTSNKKRQARQLGTVSFVPRRTGAGTRNVPVCSAP